jgi:cytochrome c553
MARQTTSLIWIALLSAAQICFGATKDKAASKIEFNRDVRAILSDNCFACHGPDDKQRKAKLRLDVKEDAFKPA